MSANPRQLSDTGELQELQVRVVRIGELGAKLPRPEPEPAEPPAARTAPPPEARVPPPQLRPAAAPAEARESPPAPAEVKPATPAPKPQAPASRPAPEVAKAAEAELPAVAAPRRLLTAGRIWFVVVSAILYAGWRLPTERYITPHRGLGYALGIIGGSLMLVLLLYSARKRWNWLSFLGSTPSWFRFHMVLGIGGPLCILYHANFSTGATNSNVALFTMLAVAGSGLIGRYFYGHIHNGLYGRKVELSELRAGAEGLRSMSSRIAFVPELVTRLDAAEQRLLDSGPKLSLLGFAKPAVVALATLRARWSLHRYIRRSLRASARRSPVVAAEYRRLRQTARAYIDRRLKATRSVAEFEGYERLFSLWHAVHIPLIFMLIVAAVIHVIAVNVY